MRVKATTIALGIGFVWGIREPAMTTRWVDWVKLQCYLIIRKDLAYAATVWLTIVSKDTLKGTCYLVVSS